MKLLKCYSSLTGFRAKESLFKSQTAKCHSVCPTDNGDDLSDTDIYLFSSETQTVVLKECRRCYVMVDNM